MEMQLIRDIKFTYSVTNESELGPGKISLFGNDLTPEYLFETSVIISIFSEARASELEDLPKEYIFKSGWFGSVLLGFELGSKMWLLDRSVLDKLTMIKGKAYILESLHWMIDLKILKEIQIEVKQDKEVLTFNVKLHRFDDKLISFGFFVDFDKKEIRGVR